MHDDPGHDEQIDPIAAEPPRPSVGRRVLVGVLIPVHTAVFTVAIGTACGIAIANSQEARSFIEANLSPEIFGIIALSVTVLVSYFLAAIMVRRWTRGVLWTTVLAVTSLVVTWLGWWGYGSYRLSRAIAAWEEVGGSLEPSRPTDDAISDEMDAAVVYRELAAVHGSFSSIYFEDETQQFMKSEWDRGLRDRRHSVVPLEEVRTLLREHGATIDRVTAATNMPSCRWSKPEVSDSGRLAAARLADLIRLAAMERIVAEDHRGAAEYLLTLLRLGRQLAEDATWLESSVGILVTAIMEMHRLRFDADLPWQEFDRELQRWDGGLMVARSLINLSSLYAEMYSSPEIGNVPDDILILKKFGLLNLDFAMYLELARRWHDEALLSTADGGAYPGYPEPVWYRPWCAKWEFADRLQFERRDWIDVERDVARVAIKVIQHRKIHGEFPDSIDGMIESLRCPLTGEPYLYAHWPGGFKIVIPRGHYGPFHDRWGLPDPSEDDVVEEIDE